ncbi:MAG: SRPBCC domain-containing protein [Proteobacteria bacterium]|nr:SRPBCC domain-containing protein [Pseudomonadota bacterium]
MSETKSVIVERELPVPPEKLWRALTQPHLIADWLMQNDFAATTGHRFRFTADWGSVDCQVLTVEENRMLSYSWAAMGLDSVVTFTLSPTRTGTHLKLEQTGFKPGMAQAYGGARIGWNNFLDRLGQLLEKQA